MGQGLCGGKKCLIVSLFFKQTTGFHLLVLPRILEYSVLFCVILCLCCFHLISQLCHARSYCPILPSHLFLLNFYHSLPQVFLTWLSAAERNHRPKKVILLTLFCLPSPHPWFLAVTKKNCRGILLFPEQSTKNYSEWVAHAQFGRDVTIQMEHPWWTGHKSLLDICQEMFSRDIRIDEILANFHSKRLFFYILL